MLDSEIGLKKGTVKIVPYSNYWKSIFENEKNKLSSLLKGLYLDIQHVGSTAIINCSAKPIIDISIKVSDFKLIDSIIKILEKDYTYKGDAGIKGRHFFVKGPPERRTHYIHIVPDGSLLWENHIYFRDYLNSHPDYIIEYNAIKRALVKKYANDRESYSSAKSEFIVNTIKIAKEYYTI